MNSAKILILLTGLVVVGCDGTNRRRTTYSQLNAYAPSAYAVPPRPAPSVPFGSGDAAGGVVLTTDVAGNVTIRTPDGVRVLECYDAAGFCRVQ